MKFLQKVRTATLATTAILLTLVGSSYALTSQASAASTNLFPSDDGAVTAGVPAGYNNNGGGGAVSPNTLTVVTPGHTGANALKVTMTDASKGAADWYPTPVAVTAGQQYTFSVAYESTVTTEIGADFYTSAGAYMSYQWGGSKPACTTWCTATATLTIPAGAGMVTAEQDIYTPGTLTTDDYSLTSGAAPVAPGTPKPISTTAGTVTNGGLETIDATSGLPIYWAASQWGTNTGTIATVSTAHTGTHAVKAQITAYTSGAQDLYQQIPVTPGVTYKVSVAVASNVAVQVGGQGVDASGNEIANSWSNIANVAANNTGTTPTNWTVTAGGFTAPAGAAYEEILVPLASVGWVVTDDYTVAAINAPASFSSGMVTVALDDGWAQQYTNGRSILIGNKIPVTLYIIGSEIGDAPDYMTAAQIKTMVADGDEVGNHTWDHPDDPALATFTAAQIKAEFTQAQTAIKSKIGVTPTTCAYPDGSYNSTVLSVAQSFGFVACRSVDTTTGTFGANTPGMLAVDPQYRLHLMDVNVDDTTPASEIEAAINYAKANNEWVILTYHGISPTGTYPGGDQYVTTTADFQTEMAYLHNSGVQVKPMAAAYAWAAAQVPAQ